MIGIIGAMDTEVDNIKAQVKGKTVSFIAGVEFVCGFIEDVTVCVAKCSPGKVNAAICTQAMIDNFDIDMIINVGVACSLSKDVIIKMLLSPPMFANMTLILPLWVSHAVLSTGLMLLKLKLTKKYPSFWQELRFPAVKNTPRHNCKRRYLYFKREIKSNASK